MPDENEEMIPKSRFNEVNRKFKEYQSKNADLLTENAELKSRAEASDRHKKEADSLRGELTKLKGFVSAGIQDADVGNIVYDRWQSSEDSETPFSEWVKTTSDPIVGKLLTSPPKAATPPPADLPGGGQAEGEKAPEAKPPVPDVTSGQKGSGLPPTTSQLAGTIDDAIRSIGNSLYSY